MAAPLSTLYDVFLAKYLHKMGLAARAARVTCAIHIGSILGTLRGCTVSVLNRCNNNDRLSFALLAEAFAETAAMLPAAQRAALAAELGLDPDAPRAPSALERHCRARAALTQNIDLQTLHVGSCEAPPGRTLELRVVNSGSAAANCGLEAVLRALTRQPALVPVEARLPLPRATLARLLATAAVLLLLLLTLRAVRRRLRLQYRYGAYLYV
ncbi:S-S bond formation pathway protein [Equine molluscum contagiosum-like virus]|nr:S-S bond formation pathway protein [Equine molluscum contagiosum-like virus]